MFVGGLVNISLVKALLSTEVGQVASTCCTGCAHQLVFEVIFSTVTHVTLCMSNLNRKTRPTEH